MGLVARIPLTLAAYIFKNCLLMYPLVVFMLLQWSQVYKVFRNPHPKLAIHNDGTIPFAVYVICTFLLPSALDWMAAGAQCILNRTLHKKQEIEAAMIITLIVESQLQSIVNRDLIYFAEGSDNAGICTASFLGKGP